MEFKVYAGNADQWIKASEKKCYASRELSCTPCHNGILLPVRKKSNTDQYMGGVCDEEYRFLAGLIRESPTRHKGVEVNASYRLPPHEKIERRDETIIFGGCLAGHFGHFISEGMGRLWYILRNEHTDARIAFLPFHPGEQKWFWDFFELLKIPRERILMVDHPMQFREILIPEESVHTWGSWYTRDYTQIYQVLRQNAGTGSEKKVYLTHRDWGRGPKIFHEEYFEKFYRDRGFLVIAPETISVRDQVCLISGAEELVTTLGTLSHLAIFCKPDTHVTILSRVENQILPPQLLMNEAANIHVTFVDVSRNFLYPNRLHGAILIGISEYWRQYVREYFHEEAEESTEWKDACYEYMKEWTKFYADHPNKFERLSSEDPLEGLSRMCRILLGKEINRSKFSKKNSMKLMQDQLKKYQSREADMQMQVEQAVRVLEGQKGRPLLMYEVHKSGRGWIPVQYEDLFSVNEEMIEAIKIRFTSPFHEIHYSTYSRNDGWGSEVSTGEISGTTGQKKPLSGIYMRLDESGEKDYSICYRICCGSLGWSDWTRDGSRIWTDKGYITGLELKCTPRKREERGDYLVMRRI